MSFILDALKKSENERQRQAGPGFATVPESSSRKTRRPWPIVLAGLIAINLAVLGFMLLRGGSDPASSSLPQSGPPATPGIAVPKTPAPTPLPAKEAPAHVTSGAPATAKEKAPPEDLAPPASAPEPADSPSAALEEREVRGLASEAAVSLPSAATPPPPTDTGQTPSPAVAAPPGPAVAGESAAGADDSLPTANDLRLEGFLTGPPLHLDLHVYYPENHRRVVFISGDKYREGDRVRNGPVIREIVPDGVILEERGRQYLLLPD